MRTRSTTPSLKYWVTVTEVPAYTGLGDTGVVSCGCVAAAAGAAAALSLPPSEVHAAVAG
jgi:hypothetical protein